MIYWRLKAPCGGGGPRASKGNAGIPSAENGLIAGGRKPGGGGPLK